MSLDELEALLLVQERDIALDQLRHRRVAMPERAELIASSGELRKKEGERAEVGERHRVVLADERRVDDEAQAVGAHADEVNTKLYSGTVSSPKELQAMQADIDMLKRRRSDLEDEELEIMEKREVLDAEVAALDAVVAALWAKVTQLGETIAANEREIDDEIAHETSVRAELAAPITESLLRDYERRREQNRGAGAAKLVGTTCQACHLTVPSTEAEQIRKNAGSVISYCDNCSANPRTVTQPSLFEGAAVEGAAGEGAAGDGSGDAPHKQVAEVLIYCDGGSRGNPGPSAIGAVVFDPSTDPPSVLAEVSEYIGVTTNNVAEYKALIAGLEAAAPFGAHRLLVRADSKLVIEQVKGTWKVKQPHLMPLRAEAYRLVKTYPESDLRHVPRAQNTAADALVNAALDALADGD